MRRFLVPVRHEGNVYVLKLTAKEYETGKVEFDRMDPESVKLYDQKIAKDLDLQSKRNA